jgi:hypothetical protein
MKYDIQLKGYNEYTINGESINYRIFEEELFEYKICDRESEIDNLINYISETNSENDKYLMKEDLKYLLYCKDDYMFSSISTNDFVFEEDNTDEFDKICKALLELNKEVNSRDTKRMED